MMFGLLKILSSYPIVARAVVVADKEAEGGGAPVDSGVGAADWPPGEKNGRLGVVPPTERELAGGEPKVLLPKGDPIGVG